ncbi:MAG TPA: outer membrane beta-barrel protein [Candidatus Saccharimonadales bacterium]|nr:outer membrane beta-barrel protein [Candidatus Saccharimonadales bacterium]
MIRTKMIISGVLVVFFFLVSSAKAQEGDSMRSEVALQGTGFFTKDSQQIGTMEHSTNTGGILLSYRFHFNHWLAVDASYGFDRNAQQNFTPLGNFNIQTNVHQATAALIASLPVSILRLKPYVLAGTGALVFSPTGNMGGFIPGEQQQGRATFVWGGGVDYRVFKQLAIRVEYRGFVYDRPDFGLPILPSHVTSYTSQPSAGVVLHF